MNSPYISRDRSSRSSVPANRAAFWLVRVAAAALILAGVMIAPRTQQAQDACSTPVKQGCYAQAKSDIAFLIDRSGSIAQRGQTFNIEIDGVVRALRDSTVIPRDGSIAVAVVLFNEGANVVVPLTEINSQADAEAVANTVLAFKCGSQPTAACPFGGTSYTSAISAADINLSRARSQNPKPGVHRVFVLSSDGEPDDPDLGVGAANEARIAATTVQIPFEFNVILMGLDTQSSDFAASKERVDQLVSPKPVTTLPGATLSINSGPCNASDATSGGDDCSRQAGELSELIRSIVRGPVPAISPVVGTENDTAPDTPVAPGTPMSLRQAIEAANCNGGSSAISLTSNLRGKTIHLESPLPPLTQPDVTINACDGADCAPLVTIDGGGTISDGLLVKSNRAVLKGLKFVNFTRSGIAVDPQCVNDNPGHNRIEQNVFDNIPTGVLITQLPGTTGNSNVRNKISRNSFGRPTPGADAPVTALIDLGGDGPTANDDGDADQGPNTLLNFPDSLTVLSTGANVVNVAGLLASPPPGGATVEIYSVTRFRTAAGRVLFDAVNFLGQTTADSKGVFSSSDLPASPTGIYTATVTDTPDGNPSDPSSNTSELMFDSAATPLPHGSASFTFSGAFGDVQLGAPKSIPFDITNTGKAPLVITGCSIGRCPNATSDNRDRFTIAGCPTAPINPGQKITITVTFNPTGCGIARACLFLQTNDPFQPQIVSELTGTGTAPAHAVISGAVTTLSFKRVAARGFPKANPKTMTFVVQNTGCVALDLQTATFTRGGKLDDSGTFSIRADGAQGNFPVTVAAQGSVTLRVAFNPVIPAVVPSGTTPGVKDILPDDIFDSLSIRASTGETLGLQVSGGVKKGIQLINPTNPAQDPLIKMCQTGDDLIVEFSAYDANTNLTRAEFLFLDSSGLPVASVFNITGLDAIVSGRGIAKGQSFTISQKFTGALSVRRIASVQVTVFDGEGSATGTSSGFTTGCSVTVQSQRLTGSAVDLPAIKLAP